MQSCWLFLQDLKNWDKMHLLAYKQWLILLRKLKRIARSKGSAHSIAFGAAIGFFIGMEPIMGIQMVVAAFIATILKANRIAAILPVWVSNPATFIPLYGFNYWIGYKLTGWGPGLDEYEKVLKQAEIIAKESGFINGIIEGSKHLASLGTGALASLFIGCTIVGIVSAVIAYPVCLRAVEFMRHRRQIRREKRHHRFLELLKKHEEKTSGNKSEEEIAG